jgi:TorA maturation chaperone TorD
MRIIKPFLRAVGYKGIALLYEYPEKETLEGIEKEGKHIINAFSELSKNHYFKDLSVENLFLSVKNIPIEQFQAEYIRLFEYDPLCPPYETAYINSEPSKTLLLLQELYRKFGLQPRFSYPVDIFIIQLEFMSHLICIEDTLSQKKFLETHLAVWVTPFSECIKKQSSLAFYRSLAHLTLAFIKADLQYLKSILA